MNKELLERYRKYAGTEEAFAVLFVKTHLPHAKGHWANPIEFERYEKSPDPMHFRYVVGEIYPRKLTPKYPPKSAYTINGRFDERRYHMMIRAITWETAHKDMDQQKAAKVRPLKFEVRGVSYDRNRGSKGFFRDDAPPEIKALAANLSDRTNLLWEKALKYAKVPEFVYEIKKAKVY